MKKISIRLAALILIVSMLSGCGLLEEYQRLKQLYYGGNTAFSDMEYQRPDPDDFLACQQQCLALAEAGTDLDALVETLPVAKKQLVAIARAITFDSKVIVMDEPTAALSSSEVEMLYNKYHDYFMKCAVTKFKSLGRSN